MYRFWLRINSFPDPHHCAILCRVSMFNKCSFYGSVNFPNITYFSHGKHVFPRLPTSSLRKHLLIAAGPPLVVSSLEFFRPSIPAAAGLIDRLASFLMRWEQCCIVELILLVPKSIFWVFSGSYFSFKKRSNWWYINTNYRYGLSSPYQAVPRLQLLVFLLICVAWAY